MDSPATPAIGVDVGSKRIGIASSIAGIATPLQVLERSGDDEADAAKIVALATERGARTAVVGLPLNMSGTRGPAVDAAEQFGAALEAAGLSIVFWDERLTTVTAERVLLEAGTSRAGRKKVIDKIAATVILQSYLDAKR